MKKTENKETGEVSFSFTGQEIKKLKIGAIAAAVVFAASICIGGYSAYSMTSLRQENTLYRNQLKMAEEKMFRTWDLVMVFLATGSFSSKKSGMTGPARQWNALIS